MKTDDCYQIKLENFEGPLEFLLCLVQKNEIDLSDIRLRRITEQFIGEMQHLNLDDGAEFVGTVASLVWLKSKLLLPTHEQDSPEEEEEGPDPHFDVIHKLIDYCRFKEAGRALVHLEKEQSAHFARGLSGQQEGRRPLGIDHLSLEDLAHLFHDIIQKGEGVKGQIHEEVFRVSDKILLFKKMLKSKEIIELEAFFKAGMHKDELIVTFLAILELMKLGNIWVLKDSATQKVFVKSNPKDGTADE